jgi:hypothetical protein
LGSSLAQRERGREGGSEGERERGREGEINGEGERGRGEVGREYFSNPQLYILHLCVSFMIPGIDLISAPAQL